MKDGSCEINGLIKLLLQKQAVNTTTAYGVQVTSQSKTLVIATLNIVMCKVGNYQAQPKLDDCTLKLIQPPSYPPMQTNIQGTE